MDAVEERRKEAGYKYPRSDTNVSQGSLSGGDGGGLNKDRISGSGRGSKNRRAKIKARGRASLGGIFLRSGMKKRIALDSSGSLDDDEGDYGEKRYSGKGRGRQIGATAETRVEELREMQSAAKPVSKTSKGPKVCVCVRKRPLSTKERTADHKDIISTRGPKMLHVHELKSKIDLTKYVETHNFQFDAVFSESANNEDVYEQTARPLVDVLFDGGRATCFAYGQTGAGKTYTMQGNGFGDNTEAGLYALAVHDIFDRLAMFDNDSDERCNGRLCLFVSFYEIYGSGLHDLLDDRASLACREDGNNEVQIVGLTARRCSGPLEVLELIAEASQCRSTGVTGANDDSSRSHAVFQVELRRVQEDSMRSSSNEDLLREQILGTDGDCEQTGIEVGRLCFIDLAGSERGSDTAANDRATRMEGAEINKSLLALKECIRAMDKKKDHTPFRGSKLTQVLKASFTGKNSRTVMIANVSPSSANVEHTLNTLRYADRVKEMGGDRSGSSRKENELWGGQRKRKNTSMYPQDRTKSMSIPRESLGGADISVLRKMKSGHKPPRAEGMKSRSTSRSRLRAPLPPGPRTRSQTKRAAQLEPEITLQPKRKPRKSCIARPSRTKGSLARSPRREEDELADAKLRVAKLKAMAYTESRRVSSMDRTAVRSLGRKNSRKAEKSEFENSVEAVDHLQSLEIDNQGDDDLLFTHTADLGTKAQGSRKLHQTRSGSTSSSISKATPATVDLCQEVVEIDSCSSEEHHTPQGEVQSPDNVASSSINTAEISMVAPESPSTASDVRLKTKKVRPIDPRVSNLKKNANVNQSPSKQNSEDQLPKRQFTDIASPDTSSPLSSENDAHQTRLASEAPEPVSMKPSESKTLQVVIGKHREEINEMMRLVKTNVILLEQIENGLLSKNQYATKLELNLAQQMDTIQNLKQVASKLWQPDRRRDRHDDIEEVI
eukprot:Plantae.Rhodophyta-Hildenbrandia_rubra.ctg338.p1 GENE.Plantae.Rhodophyta-Hildenbrandia_rubra.ctg338~~Plantae.Rhodophyta-Hildenbrandia_rubra.ctg338.p1  ORF type:complete len:950 (+),score=190.28 Plantae.Rhodophyta-Hildenbrandia_rubra.ctg338:1142-3991(+)